MANPGIQQVKKSSGTQSNASYLQQMQMQGAGNVPTGKATGMIESSYKGPPQSPENMFPPPRFQPAMPPRPPFTGMQRPTGPVMMAPQRVQSQIMRPPQSVQSQMMRKITTGQMGQPPLPHGHNFRPVLRPLAPGERLRMAAPNVVMSNAQLPTHKLSLVPVGHVAPTADQGRKVSVVRVGQIVAGTADPARKVSIVRVGKMVAPTADPVRKVSVVRAGPMLKPPPQVTAGPGIQTPQRKFTAAARKTSSVRFLKVPGRTPSRFGMLGSRNISSLVLFAHGKPLFSSLKLRREGKPKLLGHDFELVYVMFVASNLVIFIFGSLILTLGVKTHINIVYLLRLLHSEKVPNTYHFFNGVSMLRGITSSFILLGVLIISLGLLGFFGVVLKKQKWLSTYGGLSFVLVLLELVAILVLLLAKDSVQNYITDDVTASIKEEYDGHPNSINTFTQALDFIQVTLGCCGPTGYKNFEGSPWYRNRGNNTVPLSCCRMANKETYLATRKVELFDESCPTSKPGKYKDFTGIACTETMYYFLRTRLTPSLTMMCIVLVAQTMSGCVGYSASDHMDDWFRKKKARQQEERKKRLDDQIATLQKTIKVGTRV